MIVNIMSLRLMAKETVATLVVVSKSVRVLKKVGPKELPVGRSRLHLDAWASRKMWPMPVFFCPLLRLAGLADKTLF